MFDFTRLHICLIAGTLGQGGAERQLFYIARALSENGATVQLLCLTRGEYWEERIRQLGVLVTSVGEHGGKISRIRSMLELLRSNPPDVVQSQHFYTNLYAVAAARMLRCREVGAMRNDCVNEVAATGVVMGRLSLRAPRTIAANSRAAIRHAITMGVPPTRLHLLGNVVDTLRFTPAIVRKQGGPVHLIAVGRLEKQKRIDRFLSVLARIRSRTTTPFRATIVGAGSLRSALEAQAAALGLLDEVVEFRGAVSDVAEVYQEADILVMTSDYEGTPNVALEAMASGLTVVATRVGGVQEVIDSGETGQLVDPTDEEGMSNALSNLISDPDRRRIIGQRATRFVRTHHSPAMLLGQLGHIYSATVS